MTNGSIDHLIGWLIRYDKWFYRPSDWLVININLTNKIIHQPLNRRHISRTKANYHI